MPENGAYVDRAEYDAVTRGAAEARRQRDGFAREVEQLRELVRNLLAAWLNGWEPGENQDLIDGADQAAVSGSTDAPKPPQ